MAVTLAQDRMYPMKLHPDAAIAPTVDLGFTTGTAITAGELGLFTSGLFAKLSSKNVTGATALTVGFADQSMASGNASGTPIPVTLALPYHFYVGTFAKGSAFAQTDIPDTTGANGYRTANDGGSVGFAVISGTSAAGEACQILMAASQAGRFTIRGNILGKNDTSGAAGQNIVSSNLGVVGDSNVRVVFSFVPTTTAFYV